MKPISRSEQAIAAEAAEWHVRQKQLGPQEQQAFAEWLKASPRHLREFLIMETLGESLNHIDPQRRLDADAGLVRSPGEVVPLHELSGTRPAKVAAPYKHARRVAAIAAGIAVLAVAGWLLVPLSGGWQNFATAVGEQRAVQLPDNSVLNLNTGSRVKVRFTAQSRDIRLLEGEAFFKVQRDTTRPFRVHTRDAVIQALGTQFNVYSRDADTTVSVLEGRVSVTPEHRDISPAAATALKPTQPATPPALSAGEQVSIGANGQIKQRPADVADAAAWRQRRLVFREHPLSDIAAEFNRYNRAPKIRLQDIESGTHHYTGTFDADDPLALARLLSQQSDLVVETTAAEILIRRR